MRRNFKQEAEVMIAFSNGVPIQVRKKGTKQWVDAAAPYFNWEERDYRIKPSNNIRQLAFYPSEPVHSVGMMYKNGDYMFDADFNKIRLELDRDGAQMYIAIENDKKGSVFNESSAAIAISFDELEKFRDMLQTVIDSTK